MRPPLALAQGEPAGIGPEIIAAAFAAREGAQLPAFFVLGDPELFAALGAPVAVITDARETHAAFATHLPVLRVPLAAPVTPGRPDPANANAVIAAIEQGAALAQSGAAAGLVTAPIAKHVLAAAGFAHAGHTEFLAALTGAPRAVMMLAVEGLRVVPASVHVPLAQVPAHITAPMLVETGTILAQALTRDFGLARPRIAVAGLNPHAGESGVLGGEDAAIIAPAVAELRARGIEARGPLAADTMFHEEARAAYDAALCMYHDQALIPLKTLDFWRGVNVTLGLPIVRTSPDHGTAFDIAGRGIARADSMIAAIAMARAIADRRRAHV